MAFSVLVVDDDEEFRRLAVGMLRAVGQHDVHEAATVATALSRVATSAPDVALVDIGLPDGDGVALARQLTALYPATRVVLISADGEAGGDGVAHSVGAEGFVAKDALDESWLRTLVERP